MPDELECIFCQIIGGQAPSEMVYEDEVCVAFMDINPATDGHTLVVTRQHASTLFELSEESQRGVMIAAVKVAEALRDALRPEGLNLFQANGRAAFQTVDHFHLHLVPRWSGDPIKLPWIPMPGEAARIARIAGQVRQEVGGD